MPGGERKKLSRKKVRNLSKLPHFMVQRCQYGPHPKWKTIFLAEIAKADHQGKFASAG